jgi:hypothetical protein
MDGSRGVSSLPLLAPAETRSHQPVQVSSDKPTTTMPKHHEMSPILTGGQGCRFDGTVGANLRGQQPLLPPPSVTTLAETAFAQEALRQQSHPSLTALAQTAFAQEALRPVTHDGEGWPKPIIKGAIVNGRGGRQYAVRMTRWLDKPPARLHALVNGS